MHSSNLWNHTDFENFHNYVTAVVVADTVAVVDIVLLCSDSSNIDFGFVDIHFCSDTGTIANTVDYSSCYFDIVAAVAAEIAVMVVVVVVVDLHIRKEHLVSGDND